MGEDIAAKGKGKETLKWEKFMPRMLMRVLLVEPDDSTRQVIAALLRKCGYKVSAVSDGLKAWELLKGAHCNVDLVLTEVELPSVSGIALISLAMEQEIYKNIPFIMMSSHDSMNSVYNCILKGAADYLVKPIRRNELHNLWQHVWRRRSQSVDENWPRDGIVPLQQSESAAGGDAHSSQKQDSDVQSSTEPELEPENAHKEDPLKRLFKPRNPSGTCEFGLTLSPSKEASRRIVVAVAEGSDDNHSPADSYIEAIDLIGAFDDSASRRSTNYLYHHSSENQHLSTKLNLSLERSHPHDLENSVTEERCSVKQSNGSAFSRYMNNLPLPQKSYGIMEKEIPHTLNNASSETPSPSSNTPKSILSLSTSCLKQMEYLLPHQRPVPASVPVKVLSSNSPNRDLTPPSPSLNRHQGSSLQRSNFGQSYQEITDPKHPTAHSNDQSMYNGQVPEAKFDTVEGRGNWSLSTHRSATISCVNESLNRFNEMELGKFNGSGARANQIKDEGCGLSTTLDEISQQALQREAALMKFRLKRKVRCFEKKVRYESRKKLAEQRPRVKGQFVRQVAFDMCTN